MVLRRVSLGGGGSGFGTVVLLHLPTSPEPDTPKPLYAEMEKVVQGPQAFDPLDDRHGLRKKLRKGESSLSNFIPPGQG